MVLNYIKSQSSVKPELIDSSSSRKVVYLRQNIIEVTATDEMTGEERTYFEYDEAKLTKAEYEEYLKELGSTQTLENIENLKEENQMLTEEVLGVQMALVEVYEQLLLLSEGI